ncbi:hypothetical protein BJX63DRAFT_431740 [Aspergillus granulosus]|uniref:Uncharacterized protein n=1 Tax=Aspergillus granulosus TaxID=176169 RepID=A0ABR4HGJ1_9EURO
MSHLTYDDVRLGKASLAGEYESESQQKVQTEDGKSKLRKALRNKQKDNDYLCTTVLQLALELVLRGMGIDDLRPTALINLRWHIFWYILQSITW